MSDCQSNNNLTCWDQSGAGGGGSGGSIYLVAKYVNVGEYFVFYLSLCVCVIQYFIV